MARTKRRPGRSTPPPDYLLGEPIRPAQWQYIETLLGQRQVPDEFSAHTLLDKFHRDLLDKDSASDLIDALKALPRVFRGGRAAGRSADLPNVPPGRYCIFGGTGSKAQFYRVRYGSGQFEGWAYLDIQSDGGFYPVTSTAQARRILEAIQRDPQRAAERYINFTRLTTTRRGNP